MTESHSLWADVRRGRFFSKCKVNFVAGTHRVSEQSEWLPFYENSRPRCLWPLSISDTMISRGPLFAFTPPIGWRVTRGSIQTFLRSRFSQEKSPASQRDVTRPLPYFRITLPRRSTTVLSQDDRMYKFRCCNVKKLHKPGHLIKIAQINFETCGIFLECHITYRVGENLFW